MKNEVKLAWICGIFGLMVLILGVRQSTRYSRYISINAHVTNVREQHVYDEDDYRYRVDYLYHVNTISYKGYFETNTRYNVDDAILIYYDPDNPVQMTRGGKDGPIVFILFGAGTVIASIVYGFRYSE